MCCPIGDATAQRASLCFEFRVQATIDCQRTTPVKRHRGEPGHTKDTYGTHIDTRITQEAPGLNRFMFFMNMYSQPDSQGVGCTVRP